MARRATTAIDEQHWLGVAAFVNRRKPLPETKATKRLAALQARRDKAAKWRKKHPTLRRGWKATKVSRSGRVKGARWTLD